MKKYTIVFLLLICLPLISAGQSSLTLNITGYDAHCNGSINGSARVLASGGVAPYSYSWTPVPGTSDSISDLAAGIYSVTVTDNTGLIATGSVTISQPPALTVWIDRTGGKEEVTAINFPIPVNNGQKEERAPRQKAAPAAGGAARR